MDTRRILTFVLIFGALMLVMPYIFGNGKKAPTTEAYPIYLSPAKEPLASEGDAKPESIQLGDAGKASKDKVAVIINSQTAGIDLVQLNINDYPQTVERKDPLTLLQATPGLAKPFATLGLHVTYGNNPSEQPLGTSAADLKSIDDEIRSQYESEIRTQYEAEVRAEHKDASPEALKGFLDQGEVNKRILPEELLKRQLSAKSERIHDDNNSVLFRKQYVWKKIRQSPTETALLMTLPDNKGAVLLELTKTFTIDPASYEVTISHSIRNFSAEKITVSIDQLASTELPRDSPQQDDRYFHAAGLNVGKQMVQKDKYTLVQAQVQKLDKGTQEIGQLSDYAKDPILWTAASSRFFAVIVRPLPSSATPSLFSLDGGATIPEVHHVKSASVDLMRYSESAFECAGAIRLTGNQMDVPAGQTINLPLTVYMGPKKQEILEGNSQAKAPTTNADAYALYIYSVMIQYNPGGPCGVLTFPLLAQWIMAALGWLAKYVTFGNYGVAIMVLVIVVRAALHPLTRASQINMAVMAKKMKLVQPQVEAAKKKYANNKQKQNEEMMRIYRENQVNPAGGILGCLPMLVQMPIWAALYSGLRVNIDLRLAPFIPGWINDLANPDTLWPRVTQIGHPLFTLPLLGEVYGLNLLPILLTAVFFIQMKVQTASQPKPADEQQAQMQKMSQYMIFIFPLFLYGAPSGLNLYIFASTMGGLLDTYLVRKTLKKRGILPATAEALPTHEQKDEK